MSVPKWTEERTSELEVFVGDESPVSQATVAEAAERLETSTRSVASKLRKMGLEVEPANSRASRAFSDEQENTLREFVTNNAGEYTYKEVSEAFADGAFSAKQIQGKVLSMELTDLVKKAPKVETQRTYSPAEEETFISMARAGATIEALAEALSKPANSIRGKALSLIRSGDIEAIPHQEHTKSANREDPLTSLGDLSEMSVEAIAEAISKTPRGVRVMLTRRALTCANYDGAAKAAKNAEAAAA